MGPRPFPPPLTENSPPFSNLEGDSWASALRNCAETKLATRPTNRTSLKPLENRPELMTNSYWLENLASGWERRVLLQLSTPYLPTRHQVGHASHEGRVTGSSSF